MLDRARQASAPDRGVIGRLQALRFVAAGLVLVGHVLMEIAQHSGTLGSFAALGRVPWGIGVDIFFVISGFIITHASIDRPATPASVGDFMVHRVIRLWPTYAFFTALMLIAMQAVPGFLKHSSFDLPYILASFVFLPWARPGDGRPYPVLGQGWTLNYEMFFYVSFAMVLFLPARFRIAALWAGGLGLVAAGQMFALPMPFAFYAKPVILEFLAGALLCLAYRRLPEQVPLGIALIVAALVFLLLVPVDTEVPSRFFYAGLPAACIVAGTLMIGRPGERMFGRPLPVLLGNASYALYLCHPFVVNAVLWTMTRLIHPVPMPLFFVVAIVASVVGSLFAYWLVEKPFLRLLKPRYQALRARRGTAVAGA